MFLFFFNILCSPFFVNNESWFDPALVFAWEAYERGSEVHLQADPTKLEVLHNSFKVKKEDFKEQQRDSILEKVRTTAVSCSCHPKLNGIQTCVFADL